MSFRGAKTDREQTAANGGTVEPIDPFTPAHAMMAREREEGIDPDDDPPRIASAYHADALLYLAGRDTRSGAEIARAHGVTRQAFNRVVCRLADRIGVPVVRGEAHRDRKKATTHNVSPTGGFVAAEPAK